MCYETSGVLLAQVCPVMINHLPNHTVNSIIFSTKLFTATTLLEVSVYLPICTKLRIIMDNYTGHISYSPVPFQHTNWLLLLPSSDHSLPGIWQVGFDCLFSTSKPTIQWDPSKDWNVARCMHPTLWIKLVCMHITHDYTSKLSASFVCYPYTQNSLKWRSLILWDLH